MKPGALVATLLLTLPSGVGAHPHTTVEQQAILSLGRTQAILSYLIRPSTGEGAHMFDHLDSNGNAQLEHEEGAAFANELLAATNLSVNGKPMQLHFVDAGLPDRESFSVGGGLIEVKVQTEMSLDPALEYDVTLEVTHHQFAESWFLQPHYFPDLLNESHSPDLERFSNSSSISIHISENGS